MTTGLMGLVLVRALMGAMEGSYCPTSFTAVAAASRPARRGFNQGLQQSGFALLGLGLGPIIATQLMRVVPSWHSVFWICALPGFVVGVLLFMVLREPAQTQGGALIGATQASGSWLSVLKSRNIVLGMLALFCAMSCVFVLSALVPTYLVEYLKLSPTQMGVVTSALGFGGFFGQFGVPGLSDVFGRKLMAVIGFVGSAVSLWVFVHTGAEAVPLFIGLFVVSFFCHVAEAEERHDEQAGEQRHGREAPRVRENPERDSRADEADDRHEPAAEQIRKPRHTELAQRAAEAERGRRPARLRRIELPDTRRGRSAPARSTRTRTTWRRTAPACPARCCGSSAPATSCPTPAWRGSSAPPCVCAGSRSTDEEQRADDEPRHRADPEHPMPRRHHAQQLRRDDWPEA